MSQSSSLQSFRLNNGVEVLADVATHFRSVAVSICLLGGSREENLQTIGLTHLLEHLLFKRTNSKTPQQIAAAVDDLGGSINAITDVDSLCLYGQVPREHLDSLFSFFCELLFDAKLSAADLELEKGVIKQEIVEASEDPQDVVYTRFSREFWPENSLGLPVFGLLETVEKFSTADLRGRLSELLVGSRILVSVAGDVDMPRFLKTVEDRLGTLPAGSKVIFEKPGAGKGIHLIECPVSQVFLALGTPWPTAGMEEFYSGQVLASILGAGISSRLFQKIREENGLAYDVGAEVVSYTDAGLLLMNATVEGDNTKRCLELILHELKLLEESPVSQAELERSQRMIEAQIRMQEDSIIGRLWRLMYNHQTYGKLVSYDEELSKYQAVSLPSINTVVRNWISKRELLLVLGGEIEGLEEEGALPPLR